MPTPCFDPLYKGGSQPNAIRSHPPVSRLGLAHRRYLSQPPAFLNCGSKMRSKQNSNGTPFGHHSVLTLRTCVSFHSSRGGTKKIFIATTEDSTSMTKVRIGLVSRFNGKDAGMKRSTADSP
jgi:hypothetical protein